MKINKFLNSQVGAVVAIAAVAAGALYVAEKKIRETAGTVGAAITPTNPDNIFNSGVNSVVQTLTNNPHQTLGGWIYDKLHTSDGGN